MEIETPDETAELSTKPSGIGRLIMVLGITLPLALGAGVLIGTYTFAPARSAPPPAASVEKSKPAPAATAPVPVTLIDRATSGDYKALDELKARPAGERSAEETLALARGRSHNKSAALEGFGKEIKKNADLLNDKNQLTRLKEFLNDRETTNQAAALVVDLPGTLGPDLLYEVVAATKNHTETSDLADDLLSAKEVREKASPALALTLDLRKAQQCEEFKTLLPRAEAEGDRRAVPILAKLTKKRGCGDNKLGDCYECIRPLEKDKNAIDLVDALKAVLKRPSPKL